MRHPIVPRDEWIAGRKELLIKEKELTRLRDRLNAERRALPWVKIEKQYIFDGPSGRETLADLFAGRSQLIVKHFMFGPGWKEGCVGCSFEIDHAEASLVHLENHDVSYVAVSRAPLAEIEAFRKRMGWRLRWVSSCGSDFNFDFHVSFTEDEVARGEAYYNYDTQKIPADEVSGRSVFYKDESGNIFHTYSAYARGGEMFLGTYHLLDITPNGRNESINGNLTDWVRHHDRYDTGGTVAATGRYVSAADRVGCCATPSAEE